MSASKGLVGAVCLPKHLTPPLPNHLVYAVYLYSLFLKIDQVHMHRFAHSFTCSHLQIVQPPFSLVWKCNSFLHAQQGTQTLTPTHTCVHMHIRTRTPSLCTRAQKVQVHRMCVLVGSPQVQTCICKSARHTSVHVYADTHIHAAKGQEFRWSFSQVWMLSSLRHFGCVQRSELLRLYFLAPNISPLPGSPNTVADNVASQLCSWPAGLVKVWRTEVLFVP